MQPTPQQKLRIGILTILALFLATYTPAQSTLDNDWALLKAYEQVKRPNQAMLVALRIYHKAKLAQQPADQVKAIICHLRYNVAFAPQPIATFFHLLQEEVEAEPFPVKQVLQSMLAEQYMKLYDHRVLTKAVEKDTADGYSGSPENWTNEALKKIAYETYLQSLQPAEKLLALRTEDFKVMMAPDALAISRGSLMDFLGWRAIDAFRKAYAFELLQYAMEPPYFLLDSACFAPAAEFATHDFVTDKPHSPLHAVLNAYQVLTAAHLQDKEPHALIELESKRLKMAHQQARLRATDRLYFNALSKCLATYAATDTALIFPTELVNFVTAMKGNSSDFSSYSGKTYDHFLKDVCTEAIARYPKALRTILLQNALESAVRPDLTLDVPARTIPNQRTTVELTYKNCTKIWLRIAKRPPGSPKGKNRERSRNSIRHLPSVFDTLLTFSPQPDLQRNTLKLSLPALPSGNYLVLCGTDKGFMAAETGVQVLGMNVASFTWADRPMPHGEREILVIDRTSGEPISGMKLALGKRDNAFPKANTFVSDSMGIVRLPRKSIENGRLNFLQLKRGKETFVRSTNHFEDELLEESDAPCDTTTLIFTDRKIYRPGQKLQFKVLMLQDSLGQKSILPGRTLELALLGAHNDTLGKKTFTTNAYGSISGEFPLPEVGLNGTYWLRSKWGVVWFKVEDYRRPRFELLLEPNDSLYQIGQTVHVRGSVKSYADFALSGSKVDFTVSRAAEIEDWNKLQTEGAIRYPSRIPRQMLHGQALADEGGNFDLHFVATDEPWFLPSDQPTYAYTVLVQVTDPTGETHERSVTITIPKKTLTLKLSFADQVWKEVIPVCKIYSEEYFANPVACTGSYKIFQLNAEGENEKIQFQGAFNLPEQDTVPVQYIRNWPSGKYRIEVEGQTRSGEKSSDAAVFELMAKTDLKIPVKANVWWSQGTLEANAGDTARFWIGTSEKDVPVWMEWEVGNTIVYSKWLHLHDEMRRMEIPITEAHCGGLTVHLTTRNDDAITTAEININVPWRHKQLEIEYATFRDHITPGAEEAWIVKIKGPNGDQVAAEMVADMYDFSLDAIIRHDWPTMAYDEQTPQLAWELGAERYRFLSFDFQGYSHRYLDLDYRYEWLNWMQFDLFSPKSTYAWPSSHSAGKHQRMTFKRGRTANCPRFPQAKHKNLPPRRGVRTMYIDDLGGDDEPKFRRLFDESPRDPEKKTEVEAAPPRSNDFILRKNLQETAFFFPELRTDAEGNILLKFTSPEALTRWRLMTFAHTQAAQYGYREATVVTQKDLMIQPHAPRFFREGDRVTYAATVSNLSGHDLQGEATLAFFDAKTNLPVDVALGNAQTIQPFSLKQGQSAAVKWNLQIPKGIDAVVHRVIAKADRFSDGEESILPILPKAVLVQESMLLPLRPNETRNFEFAHLATPNSPTLRNQSLTLEFSANPAWYAVQALPYLMEFPYECAEQTFSRYYANALATHILRQNPKIQQVFAQWKADGGEAFTSKLAQNPALKLFLLEETPWLREAKNEATRKLRIAELFDPERLQRETAGMREKLIRSASLDGGYAWFPGMENDAYLSQHILAGFGHLMQLGVANISDDEALWSVIERSVHYLDKEIDSEYDDWRRYHQDQPLVLRPIQIHALYARSFYHDRGITNLHPSASKQYQSAAKAQWRNFSPYLQGMIALVCFRNGDKETASAILKALKASAQHDPEKGMYWPQIQRSCSWENSAIEAQALLIEAFKEIANDGPSIAEMQLWLLRQKQTQAWPSTKATTEACYAILLQGNDLLSADQPPLITVGGVDMDLQDPALPKEAGTGYFQKTWPAEQVQPKMAQIHIQNSNAVPAYGAVHWQYFEEMEKVKPDTMGIKLMKTLWLEQITAQKTEWVPIQPGQVLHLGDKVRVRIIVEANQALDFVQIKDQRPACFESVDPLSGTKSEDGANFYLSPRDAAMAMFIDHMKVRPYQFSYEVRVAHEGSYAGGLTQIQCMYAPEYQATIANPRIEVE